VERDESKSSRTRLAVIGAGPGGYAAAFRAADLGLDVTLIDPEEAPGGVCLHRGCIPSKAYLHAAHVIADARRAEAWGIRFDSPRIDIDRLRSWKREVVSQLTGGLAGLAKARKVRTLRGRAVFTDSRQVVVEGIDPGRQALEFDYAIVATGSRPVVPDALAIESDRVMTSTEALELPSPTHSLLVVGGGYIGLELGSVYAALGSQVTLVEATQTLLPGVDRDLVRVLERAIRDEFSAIHLETSVAKLSPRDDGVVATFEGKGEAVAREVGFDRVLVAVGRRPNSSGLGLENTAVTLTKEGFIEVDAERRTRDPTIFAIGDVAGQPMLAHKATHEGLVAAAVVSGSKERWDARCIPAVVFTDREIAWCGMTEIEAEAAGVRVQVSRFPWQASGRALTLARGEGLTKILSDPEDGRVLGVGVCGAGAGELIGEAALAIEMGAVVEDLAATVHAHPTLSETLMEAAEVARGGSVHMKRPR
jgi:dihydrolipoamide dehydrogenase